MTAGICSRKECVLPLDWTDVITFPNACENAHLLKSIVLICVFFLPQCPTFKREADGTESPEPFAAEAKFFTESRLLQRDVQIILESCPNQIILGTILHPVGTQEVAPIGELDIKIQAFCLINCPFLVPSVTEWQHHRTPAERRLRPLR